MKEHTYELSLRWTGNLGSGTNHYSSYSRNHEIRMHGKPPIPGTSDPAFRGDPARYSPEDLLVGSLSACHMLWFLHLCAVDGITVVEYEDAVTGVMQERPDGSGAFTSVTLRPQVTISNDSDEDKVPHLHEQAHALCFIAKSVNFPVGCEPITKRSPVETVTG